MPDGTTGTRWRVVKAVLDEASERPAGERAAYVAERCGADAALRAEVDAYLALGDAPEFLERPAFQPMLDHGFADPLGGVWQPLATGARVDAFRVVRELGRGGMGIVYLAERADGEYERQVALKVVGRGMSTEVVVRRFRQERQILAQLAHPNIARLLSGGTTSDGLPYFVMEYVAGEPIDRYCARHRLGVAARLALFRDVCAAVHYAHQHLVVHRDLKPGNVLVTADGAPKLLDFGIAKVLADEPHGPDAAPTTLHALTPEYASPEQLAGGVVTTQSDIYSLGVLLYELLTGRHPRGDGISTRTEPAAHGHPEPERPSLVVRRDATRASGDGARAARDLRGDVDNIVLMAMRGEPSRRYASAAQLSEDIRRHLAGEGVIARADTVTYRITKFVRRNTLGVASVAGMVVTLAAGTFGTTSQARIAREERVRAEIERRAAERRFAEVRELATSFLFELDARIAPLPGATPAREALVQRALASLDVLARESNGDPSLRRDLAVAYQRVGDVQGKPYAPNLGHTEAALASYRKAVAILEPLAAAAPADAGLWRDLVRAYQAASAVQARSGDVAGAVATQRRAVALGESLLARAPGDTALQTLLADNLLWLGRALAQQTTVAGAREALATYERGRTIRERLAAATPADPIPRYRAGVATAYAGYALWQLGDLTGDTASYRAALGRLAASHAINTTIGARMPSNVDMRRASVDALHEMAVLHLKLGEPDSALAEVQAAAPTTRALAAADRRNAEAQRDLATLDATLAAAYVALRQGAHALDAAERSRATLQRLSAIDASSTDDLESLTAAGALVGDARRAMGDIARARAAYVEAIASGERWVAANPTSDGPRRALAARWAALADLERGLAASATPSLARARHVRAACEASAHAATLWRELARRTPAAPVDAAHAARAGAATCR